MVNNHTILFQNGGNTMNTKFDAVVTDRDGTTYQVPSTADTTETGEPILIIPALGSTVS